MGRRLKAITGALCALAALMCAGAAFAAPLMPSTPSQEVLSVGDYGEDVAVLQTELRSLSFYGGEVTGLFDGDTRAAVMGLQNFLGVHADGMFGPITFGAYWNAFLDGRLAFPEEDNAQEEVIGRLADYIIGIDPGHQQTPDAALEQMAPASKRTKERQSPGSVGVRTGTPEYKINLLIAFKLKDLLEAEGATVVMTRETSDVSISNMERARMMNDADVDIWLRLHCDSASSAAQSGASVLIPSRSYSAAIYRESLRLGKHIYETFGKATSAPMLSLTALMDQSGFNWSEKPVVAIEMGLLSNPQEDLRLNRDSYQASCAVGIFNGVVAYFEEAAANRPAE